MGLKNSSLKAILADTCINVILMRAIFFVAFLNVVDPDLDLEPDLVDHNKMAPGSGSRFVILLLQIRILIINKTFKGISYKNSLFYNI
jgi:hypothetical protein